MYCIVPTQLHGEIKGSVFSCSQKHSLQMFFSVLLEVFSEVFVSFEKIVFIRYSTFPILMMSLRFNL